MQPGASGASLASTLTSCLFFFALPSIAFAAQAAAPTIADCQAIADGAERLDCYDRIAPPPPAADVPEPASEARPSEPPPPPAGPAPAAAAAATAAAQPQEAAAPATGAAAPSAPSSSATTVLSDEIGRETVKGRPSEEDQLSVRGHVVDCKRGRSGKYVFYFDNGQVWRQKDNKRLSLKECRFDVTIDKDFFGYRMRRDNDERTVRIERVQ